MTGYWLRGDGDEVGHFYESHGSGAPCGRRWPFIDGMPLEVDPSQATVAADCSSLPPGFQPCRTCVDQVLTKHRWLDDAGRARTTGTALP